MFRAAVVAIVCLLDAGSVLAAGGNCVSKLLNTFWSCHANFSEGISGTTCMAFSNGGQSIYFDESDTWDSGPKACTCLDSGSATSPKFNSSTSSFLCDDAGNPGAFLGKVSGKKLSAQIAYADGTSSIFTCTKQTTPCP